MYNNESQANDKSAKTNDNSCKFVVVVVFFEGKSSSQTIIMHFDDLD